jgi:hypothetical protein
MRVEWDGERLIDVAASNPDWRKWLPSDPTSAHWYDAARLTRYMAAHVAHDQDLGNRDRTARDFVSEFRGLSGIVKPKRVLDEIGFSRYSLADFVGDGKTAIPVTALLESMKKHSRKIKPRDLGVIGRDHLLARFQRVGGR